VFGVPEGWTGYALAVEKTHWVGEPVAVIAASDRYIAEDALELIESNTNRWTGGDALKAGSASATERPRSKDNTSPMIAFCLAMSTAPLRARC